MASAAKLTPRQRMINLMYLVLTALLALQVSSSIIDKFVFLNQSLEHSLVSARSASENALESLKKKAKTERQPEWAQAVKRAEALKKETVKLITEIDKVKRQLINEAGGGIDERTGSVKNPKEETKVEELMIGGNKNGLGYNLGPKLNAYSDYLYKEFKDKNFQKPKSPEDEGFFPYLAVGNENNPLYKFQPIQRDKDFVEANFGQTPVVAALAVLTQKQNEIVRYEQMVLKALGAVETKEIKFDKVIAFASAESNTVARGTEYTADLLLTATSSRTDMKMYVNGNPIRVKDGVGDVTITPTSTGEASWSGEIKLNLKGKDTTFKIKKEYKVVEPVLLVLSKSKFPLYQNCANPLETSVPALGAAYQPAFGSNNGSAVPGAKLGEVTLYPRNLGPCVLSVSSGGKPVGTTEFVVRPVPPPDIVLSNRTGTTVINVENPIPANIPGVSIQAKAEPTFAATLPNEAKYRVTQLEVKQFRGGRAIKSSRFNGGVVALNQFPTKPGDAFQIKVMGVQRVNSRGEILPVKLRDYLRSFTVR